MTAPTPQASASATGRALLLQGNEVVHVDAETARNVIVTPSPTWSGVHTWNNGGIVLSGSPPYQYLWHWGGNVTAKMWFTTANGTVPGSVDAASNTLPEFVGQIGLYSNTGSANATTAYKVTFSPWIEVGSGSADAYALNPVAQANLGFAGRLVCQENDINQNSGTNHDYTNINTATASYTYKAISGGNNDVAAALWIHSIGTGKFANGVAITSALSTANANNAAFQAVAGGYSFARALGSWSNGVNLFGATITSGDGTAFISPNNVGFGSANAAGNATLLIAKVDGSNKIQYGGPAVTGHIYRINSGVGGIVSQYQGGADTAVDTTTLYANFVNPGNTIQRGAIAAADAAGVGRVVYNTSSDERLKTSLGPLDDALERLQQIKTHRYKGRDYKGDGYDVGFFAQELYTAYPWAVTPSNDPDYKKNPWQVDYGRITPLLVAAIQELNKVVQELSAEVLRLNGDRT